MTISRLTRRQAIAGTAATLVTASMHAQYALPKPKFRIVTLAERTSGDHQSFTDVARAKLKQWAPESNFTFDDISSTSPINDEFLAQYNLFLQLNHALLSYAAQRMGGAVSPLGYGEHVLLASLFVTQRGF